MHTTLLIIGFIPGFCSIEGDDGNLGTSGNGTTTTEVIGENGDGTIDQPKVDGGGNDEPGSDTPEQRLDGDGTTTDTDTKLETKDGDGTTTEVNETEPVIKLADTNTTGDNSEPATT